MDSSNQQLFKYSVTMFVFVVLLLEVSSGLANSKRHPYEFVKPVSDHDEAQGPSPFSYSNSQPAGSSYALINSNRRPALSLSDLDNYPQKNKQRSLATDSPSYYSSNTLFENVPLPPIRDEDNKFEPRKKDDYVGDFNARVSTQNILPESSSPKNLLRPSSAMNMRSNIKNNNEKKPLIGDITKDNKRRVVIPLRYRNKRRRINEDTEQKQKEDEESESTTVHIIEPETYSLQDSKPSESSEPSIQISISDLDSFSTTTTQRPTVVTSSTRIKNKSPAFVLNLKNRVDDYQESQIKTTLHNAETNTTIRDPLALPLTAEDLKNWGNDLFTEEEEDFVAAEARSTQNADKSFPPRFSDTNIMYADGDIYSRLQKHKQVFTSRNGQKPTYSSYHNVQSRELPRTSPTSRLQDMEYAGSSPVNITKHPKAQPYRRYKSGVKDDYYYYDYDYNSDDYDEDDYYYRDYNQRGSSFDRNAVRRSSKPTKKPTLKLVRKKPSNSAATKSRYPTSSITNHRYASPSPPNNQRNPSTSTHRRPYSSYPVNNNFQNHRLPAPKSSSNQLKNYQSKMTSSDKYAAYGYNPHSRLPTNHLVKKSNKRQGVLSNNYQSNQGSFSRPSNSPYSTIQSPSVPYNNPRRASSTLNRNRQLTPQGAGVGAASANGARGPAISSSTRRDKYYDYNADDYYYDDDEVYDDYYDYEDFPAKARQKSSRRRQQANNGVDRQYGGGGGGSNPLTLLVAPLAAISLLAAAAAVALNPVLVSVSLTGKKRRRRSLFGLENNFGATHSMEKSMNDKVSFDGQDVTSSITPEVQEKIDEMQVLEKFLGSVPSDIKYQQQILSMYLSCSGYTEESNKCLDRVVCEYSDRDSAIEEEDRDVISIVLYNIMGNDFVGEEYKARLRRAAKVGRDGKTDRTSNHKKSCSTEFSCLQLDSRKNNLIPDAIRKAEPKPPAKQRRNYRMKPVKKD